MPKFVIERVLPGIATWSEAQIREASLKSLEAVAELGPDIQWLHSFVVKDAIVCVYVAKDAQLIAEHGKRGGFPVENVRPVANMIDPSTGGA